MSESIQVALIVGAFSMASTLISHWLAGRKLDHITILTNSTLTAANERIDELEKIIKGEEEAE